jgi:Ca-activated chloride channel homolog
VRGAALVTAGISVALAAAFPGAAAARTATSATGPGEGMLLVAKGAARGEALPISGTQVAAHVAGFAAQVKVRQAFNNPFDRPLEAVYIFPLPHEAAVSQVEISFGDRRITTEIKTRAEAKEIFARARREGRTAAMLEQERPNVFTQSVTNIQPGQVVKVEIVYDVPLAYDSGAWEFVYPMVVGPRHVPGTPSGRPPSGVGTAPDTDQVPDGSRITPPTLPAGRRSGRNITLEVAIDPGKRIRAIDSPTHAVAVDRDEESTAVVVRLVGKDRIANKDFVLRYRLADAAPVAVALAHRGAAGPGTFALMVEPPRRARGRSVAPKELVFAIDTSASMRGEPLARSLELVRHALGQLGPRDTFRVIPLADAGAAAAARPSAGTAAARRAALAALQRLEASGETDLRGGLAALLAAPVPRGRLRVVCLLSDGLVGNDKAVLAEVERAIGPDTRLFTFGVGSAVNRWLLERLAEVGRGGSQVLLPGDSPADQVTAFHRRLRAPVMTHLAIDWGGLEVTDIVPRTVGDLYAGQPVAVVGRFQRVARGRITVRGRLGGARPISFQVPVVLDAAPGDHQALPRLWARAAIAALERDQLRSDDPSLVARITDIGLTHRLVTAYTAFVGVDERPAREGGRLRTYVVPVDMPAGMTDNEETGEPRNRRKTEAPAERTPRPDGDRDNKVDEADDESGSVEEEPDAPRTAAADTPIAAGSTGAELTVIDDGRADGRAPWRFAVGLGGGDLERGDTGDLLVGSLHLRADRAITGRLSLGARLGLLVRPDRAGDRVPLAGLLFEVGAHRLWRGALRLTTGVGPVLLDGDTAALGLGAGIGLGRRLPIELRYQHALKSGEDAGAFTLGVELSF